MIKLIVENRGWTPAQLRTFSETVPPLVTKIAKELMLINNIIVILQDNSQEQYGELNERALNDEGKIIIYNTSPDWSGDFIHELGHQILDVEKISYRTRGELVRLTKRIQDIQGDGRIFSNGHTYKNENEVFSTLFKWYIFGKVVDDGYLDVLNNMIPGAEQIVSNIVNREPLIKSEPTQTKLVFRKKKPLRNVYLDMDGVLCDFLGRYKEVFRESVEETTERYSRNKTYKNVEGAEEDFWTGMKWVSGGKELYSKLAREKNINLFILTAPTKNQECYSGKTKWILENTSIEASKIIIDSDKGKYAEQDSILVDDLEKNISAWQENGGIGILYSGYKNDPKEAIDKIRAIDKSHEIDGDNEPVEDNSTTTFSGYKIHGKINAFGLTISIENPKGSIRKGVSPNGEHWETKMIADYGYINNTHSAEIGGDHLDCFIGSYKYPKKVYVVKICDPDTKIYEEDKCFIGYKKKSDALKDFEKSYDEKWKQRILKFKTFPIKEFKKRALSKEIDL